MDRQTFITLSSIPPRFPFLGPILQTLLDQKSATAAVYLFIPERYRRFPDWDGTLPQVPPGVTILRCEKDEGPATKVLPALRLFAGQDVNILFCDDDNLYPADWLAGFLAASAEQPDAAIVANGAELRSLQGHPRPGLRQPRAQRWTDKELAAHLAQMPPPLPLEWPFAKSSGYMDSLMGRGGVMVRPEFFTAEVFDPPPVIWAVDDYWLSGHLEINGVAIWCDHRIPNPLTHRCMHLIRPLLTDTIEKHDRWAANQACIEWFRREKGIWMPGAPPEPAAEWFEKQQLQKNNGAQTKSKKKRPRPPRWRRVLDALFGR